MATTSSSRRSKGLESSINKLNLSSPPRKQTPKSAPPPDSWEDEAAVAAANDNDRSDPPSDASTPVVSGTTTPQGGDYPGPPPPTPISPSHRRGKSTDWAAFPSEPSGNLPTTRLSPRASRDVSGPSSAMFDDGIGSGSGGKRPEKTTATAGRMIAMGLGQKVPKMGEEQRQYERAVREKEKRRVEREKEERERERREAEEARRSVWDE